MHKAFVIAGTHCAGCKGLLEDVIKDVPGVTSVTVNAENGQTELDFEDSMDWETLKAEVASAGHYHVQE